MEVVMDAVTEAMIKILKMIAMKRKTTGREAMRRAVKMGMTMKLFRSTVSTQLGIFWIRGLQAKKTKPKRPLTVMRMITFTRPGASAAMTLTLKI